MNLNIENNIGYFTDIFKQIFMDIDNKDDIKVNNLPCELNDYLRLLYKYSNKSILFNNEKTNVKKYNITNVNNKVLVGFSGGKDSIATAIKLIQKGYEPILFHVKGINKSYPYEYKFAKQTAEYMKLEYIEVHVKLSGKTRFKENPTKNQMILSMMVDYGINKNIYKYSLGSSYLKDIKQTNILYDFSDAKEIYELMDKFYKHSIDKFEYLFIAGNSTDSYKTIYEYDKKIIDNMCSCMLPFRYKKNVIIANKKKYKNIKLNEGMCGSCYKCCYQYIHLVLLGEYKLDTDYFKHCIKVLRKHALTIRHKVLPKEDIYVLREYIDESMFDLKLLLIDKII